MAKAKAKAKTKTIEHRVTGADLEAAPDLKAEGVKEGDLVEIAKEDGVPTVTLRADSAFGLRCMFMVRDMAIATGDPDRAEIIATARQFDLYEEKSRADEVADES